MADTAEHGWGGATSSGLLEKATGTIAEAWFGKQEGAEGEYADKLYLFLKLINLETEEDYDEWTARLGIGKGWEVLDGGSRVAREDGTEKGFNNATDYGKFLNRVLGNKGGGKEGEAFAEAFAGALDVLVERGSYLSADVWVGLRFDFETEEYSSTVNGEAVKWQRFMPVKFVGEDDRTAPENTATTPATAEDNGDLRTTVEGLAKALSSHGEFVVAAMNTPGVVADQELLADVVNDGPEGIYAKVNA